MSGRSRAEEELLASEARYRTLFEYAPNGLLIANAESYYLDANASMCRMLGYAREELIGKHASDIVVADEIPHIEPALRAINSAMEYRQEWHFRRRDGSVFPGDVIATVMPDGNLLAVIRDITERKRAQDALAGSERDLRALTEELATERAHLIEAQSVAMMGSWEINLLTMEVSWSAEAHRIFETGPATLVATQEQFLEIVHPDDRPAVARAFVRSLDGRATCTFEHRLLMTDGRVKFVEESWRAARDEFGKPVRAVGTIRDITERKQAELRVEHLNRVYAMLSGINETIVREKDPQKMLEAACRIAVERGLFLMAWIALRDSGGRPVITAHAGATADTLQVVTSLLAAGDSGCGFTQHALRTGQHGVCNDIAEDPDSWVWRDAALRLGYASMASLPLTVRGEVIGTLNLYANARGFFDTEQMLQLDDLAMDIAFALELHERETERQRIDRALRDSEARLKDSMAELHAVSTRLNEAREQERVKMARDIHDHLGQALTALKMDVAEIRRRLSSGDTALVEKRLVEMSALIDTSVDDVRRVAAELRPVVLDDLGFISAIRAYFIDVERRGNIRCVLSTTLSDLKMPDDRATALFRILQEALTNVVRHAEAQRVEVGLTADAGSVRLVVHDDGRGIPATEARNPRALGLVGMRDRALLFGGDVIVTGLPGEGTTITVTLPLVGLST
jgi:PAS domain S-box-containing protein